MYWHWITSLTCVCCFFFFKQKTAYEMRISDWSSDVCSSDLMVVNHPWIGVREDHRLLHVFRCLANGALAGVSATQDHADPLHLVEYAPTLRREADVFVLAATDEHVVAIVGQQHPAQAEGVEAAYRPGPLLDRNAASDVERKSVARAKKG